MTAEEVLRENEQAALAGGSVSGGAIRANLTGRIAGGKKRKLNVGAVTAGLAVILVLVIFLGIFSSANYMIDAISTRLIEETDVQYADAVQSKALVFQEALEEGEIPANTAERLENAGVTVGYLDGDEFVASRFGQRVVADLTVTNIDVSGSGRGPLSLKMGDKVIPANEFFDEVNNNAALYAAFTEATYSRAAYYYDEDAQRVFREIGTTRNNFSEGESLEETMSSLMGEGNKMTVNDTTWHYEVEKSPVYNAAGEVIDYIVTECREEPDNLDSSSSDSLGYSPVGSNAAGYMNYITQSNMDTNEDQAAQNAADALKAADTTTQDQRSMLLYLGLMENISKTKAGDGNQSQINDVMNFLYAEKESTVVDPSTGSETRVTGTMLESPSLYAVLTGSKVDVSDVSVTGNSNDRVLTTAKSQGLNISDDTISKTTMSANGSSGIVGRYTPTYNDEKVAPKAGSSPYCKEGESVSTVIYRNKGGYNDNIGVSETSLQNSMYDNSFAEIGGYNGGELLVQGAVNVGRRLANASGAAPGDENAVTAYMKVTESVLAMDAEVDRMNRSPFDVTSRNTFLGSIVWNFAMMSIKSDSVISKMATVARVAGSAMSTLMPSAKADDANTDLYLNEFGDCATLKRIGAAGSATCAEIATFDTSTYKGIYDKNSEVGGKFSQWIAENVECDEDSDTCKVTDNSELATYIEYNEKRTTPVGLTDGGIVEAIGEKTNEKGGFLGWIIGAIRKLASLFDTTKKVDEGNIPAEATGAAFVNSKDNGDWDGSGEKAASYKYAQRYIALSRAISNLRQYDGDETAYNFNGFGKTNAVIAYINEHYPEIAER